jgi:hypothetical protein
MVFSKVSRSMRHRQEAVADNPLAAGLPVVRAGWKKINCGTGCLVASSGTPSVHFQSQRLAYFWPRHFIRFDFGLNTVVPEYFFGVNNIHAGGSIKWKCSKQVACARVFVVVAAASADLLGEWMVRWCVFVYILQTIPAGRLSSSFVLQLPDGSTHCAPLYRTLLPRAVY